MKLPPYYLWLTGLFIALDSFNIQLVNAQDLSQQVIIRRTAYGVPHITADNMLAAGFALGYIQLEDYGQTAVEGMVKARGEWTQYNEMNAPERNISIDRDASSKLKYARALETFSLLKKETKDMLIGFASGMNKYIELHKSEFPEWIKPDFTAYDVHARDIGGHSATAISGFLRRLERINAARPTAGYRIGILASESTTVWARIADQSKIPNPDEGSNTWAGTQSHDFR